MKMMAIMVKDKEFNVLSNDIHIPLNILFIILFWGLLILMCCIDLGLRA